MTIGTNIVSVKGKECNLTVAEIVSKIRSTGDASQIDLDLLSFHQRAMIAARLANVRRGDNTRHLADGGISSTRAAEIMGLKSGTVVDCGRTILRNATSREIAGVEAGEISVTTLARMIRAGLTPAQRTAEAAFPRSRRGKMPERIHRQRLRAEIWRCLKDGVLGLTVLPAPADVAEMIRARPSQAALLDGKLLKAQAWLEEFVHEWTKPRQLLETDRSPK
jgi:hypothetical protein